MPNDSSTGGYLLPTSADLADDAALEAIVQQLVVGLTGLPGSMVRPAWQPTVPKQPEPAVNWASVQVQSIAPDDSPSIEPDPDGGVLYKRHYAIEVLLSFYGLLGQQYAARAFDGLSIRQNSEALTALAIAFVSADPIRSVPEQINEQWVRRFDFVMHLHRQIVRNYSILNIASVAVALSSDAPPVSVSVQVSPN